MLQLKMKKLLKQLQEEEMKELDQKLRPKQKLKLLLLEHVVDQLELALLLKPLQEQQLKNQQKLLIARWLMANSDFIIFDEPTRGIDIGAKKEVYMLLNELAAQGKAILVISSELPELLGICDRILVMRDGSVRGELSAAEATQEKIMRLAATSNQ